MDEEIRLLRIYHGAYPRYKRLWYYFPDSDRRIEVTQRDLHRKKNELNIWRKEALIKGLIANADLITKDNIGMIKFQIFDAARAGRLYV